MRVKTDHYNMLRYTGTNLKIATLAQESAEVVPVKAGDYVRVPISKDQRTEMVFEGKEKPYVHAEDDGKANLILTFPKDTVLVVKFKSESRGQVGWKTKIFTSVN